MITYISLYTAVGIAFLLGAALIWSMTPKAPARSIEQLRRDYEAARKARRKSEPIRKLYVAAKTEQLRSEG